MSLDITPILSRYKMLEPCSGIVVGLSGGADSVCLLHLLTEFKIPLYAAHINHQLRGEESKSDEMFVRYLCEKWDVPLFVKSVDIALEAKRCKLSLEECGREQRYVFFSEVARQTGATTIATAHTLSDNLETVLLNMSRGTALNGLCGIAPVRDNIIRPLIFTPRREIEEYLRSRNIEYVTDSSNLTDQYSRNRIRNHVVPVLEGLNPSLYKGVARTKTTLSEDADYLDAAAKAALSKSEYDGERLKMGVLKKLHPAILSRVLYLSIKATFGIIAENDKIRQLMDRILGGESGRYQIKNDCFADISDVFLWLYNKNDWLAPEKVEAAVGENIFGRKTVILTVEKRENIHNLLTDNVADYDKIEGQLYLRSRKLGDKITLEKRKCTKSLKKLYIEKNIPQHRRERLAILEVGDRIVFAEGAGVNSPFAVDGNTQNVLTIKVFAEK